MPHRAIRVLVYCVTCWKSICTRGVLKAPHTVRPALRFQLEAHLYSYIPKYGMFLFRAVERKPRKEMTGNLLTE